MLGPILLGVVHAIVDASTVTSVMRSSHLGFVAPELAFAMVVGYDVIAFGSQVPFGWLTDRFAKPSLAILVGLVLTALALVCSASNPRITMALAGVGNALFHLGAGAMVLKASGLTRAAPAGLYVGPGALGLAFGIFYGARSAHGPLWPLLALTLAALVLFLATQLFHSTPAPKLPSAPRPATLPSRYAPWIVALLLVSITVRSLVGLSAARGYTRSELLVIGIPVAAFLGKSLGGFLADRFGWLETSVGALLFSLPFIALEPKTPWLLLGLFAFQMTMPVTLTAVAQLMPRRIATAFGFTCLALIVGALPTMFPFGKPLCARAVLGVWILFGTACLGLGLHLLGVNSWVRHWLSTFGRRSLNTLRSSAHFL
jgi:FSR family fosmidomycin resistance protein-like MFS transporter